MLQRIFIIGKLLDNICCEKIQAWLMKYRGTETQMTYII